MPCPTVYLFFSDLDHGRDHIGVHRPCLLCLPLTVTTVREQLGFLAEDDTVISNNQNSSRLLHQVNAVWGTAVSDILSDLTETVAVRLFLH